MGLDGRIWVQCRPRSLETLEGVSRGSSLLSVQAGRGLTSGPLPGGGLGCGGCGGGVVWSEWQVRSGGEACRPCGCGQAGVLGASGCAAGKEPKGRGSSPGGAARAEGAVLEKGAGGLVREGTAAALGGGLCSVKQEAREGLAGLEGRGEAGSRFAVRGGDRNARWLGGLGWKSPSSSPSLSRGLTGISVFRETDTDGQASGGSDSGDWIFTIREKDPKSLENGALQPSDLERNKVRLRYL